MKRSSKIRNKENKTMRFSLEICKKMQPGNNLKDRNVGSSNVEGDIGTIRRIRHKCLEQGHNTKFH